MFDDFKTLKMEHTSGLTADGRVYVELPKGAAYGWISDEGRVSKHVVEVDVHTVTLLLPLDEISDAPSCAHCGRVTVDLHKVEGECGEWCRECEEEVRHAA